jgi:hypothetical protein
VAANATREGELFEESLQSFFVLALIGEKFAVSAL